MKDSKDMSLKNNIEFKIEKLDLSSGDYLVVSLPRQTMRINGYLERFVEQLNDIKTSQNLDIKFLIISDDISLEKLTVQSGDSVVVKIPESLWQSENYVKSITQSFSHLGEDLKKDNVKLWMVPDCWDIKQYSGEVEFEK